MWSLRIRRLLPQVGLLVLFLTISALLAEGLVRLVLPQPYMKASPSVLEPDPPRRYRLSPGVRSTISTAGVFSHSVSINSLGMRGPEVGDRTPQTFRILALGDSFTFGQGVEIEDTFTSLAQEKLNSEISGDIEVLNSGVPGFGLPDEFAWLEHYGLQLEPDVVLINICLLNDLYDATEEEIDESLVPTTNRRSVTSLLFRHFHVARLLGRAPPVRALFGLPEPGYITYIRNVLMTHTDPPSDLALKGRRMSEAALARFAMLAEQHEFRLGAMLIPNEVNMVPDRWQGILSKIGLDPAAYDPEAPRRFFLDALAEHDIPVLDLWPLVQVALQKGEPLYYRMDIHWTPAGHRLAADALSLFMIEEDLLALQKPSTAAAL